MIDLYCYNLFKKYGPNRGTAAMLGDQIPFDSTGFKTNAELMRSLGYQDFMDLDYNGKARVNHDLNQPLPASQHGVADFLYDGGVLEHVANLGEGLTSVVRIVRTGGVIYLLNPTNDYGESYYNIDPMLQRDFFEANGFETLYSALYHRRNWRLKGIRILQRFAPALTERARQMFQKKAAAGDDGMKKFLFHDNPRHIQILPADKKYWSLPAITCSLYVGIKRKALDRIVWPHQGNYVAVK